MYTKSTSSLALWSTKPSSTQMKLSNSTIRQPNNQNRKSSSNCELVSDLPDLSHLSEDERKIIEAVLERQKAEEERDTNLARLSVKSNTNQNFSSITSSSNSLTNPDKTNLKNSQRHSISDIAQEIKQRYGSIDTGNVCDICKKTKFTSSGVGRICFSCKSRCCIRCSVKYTTKTKQIWMCLGCKRKQDEFFKSPIVNKKIFSSDYILNKTQAGGVNLSSNSNETGQANQTIPKRRLPILSNLKQLSQDETSRKNDENTIISNTTNNSDNSTENSTRKPTRLKMTLIKQASLNNPPSYFNNLSDFADQGESGFLNKNEFTSNQNKHASTHELHKSSLYNSNDNFYSSPGSSTSQFNFSRSRSKAERLQDPNYLYKSSKNPSRKNSTSNLNELAQFDTDETSLYEREKSLNILLKEKQLNQSETSNQSNAINQSRPVLEQRNSSDTPNSFEQIQTKLDELNKSPIRKTSTKKRPIQQRPQRQQPALPVLPVDTNPTLIKNKLLAELNKKQSSFNLSDDENQRDDFELINIGQHVIKNSQEDEDEDEEDEVDNEEYDLEDDDDDEIRSTTEYTNETNDEMDLESASLAANNQLNTLRSNDSIPIVRRVSLLETQHPSIDDYLIQNLKKEEILAHKINRFLSPSDWKLSNDGKKMIGHVLLKKSMITNNNSVVNSSSSSTIDSATDFNLSLSFGMKVIGGRLNPITNQLSAYVVKVKKESIADTIGRLQVDDEIVKWNGKLLRGLSFDEVYSIINKSKQDAQIELIVERVLNMQKDKIDNQHETESNFSLRNAESNITKNQLLNSQKLLDQNGPIGKIQLKLFHDSIENKLYVNVLTILINQQQFSIFSNLECIICKLQLQSTSLKKELHLKSSDTCNLDESSGLFYVNEAFTFEPIDSNLVKDLTIQIDTINYRNKQVIGKSHIVLSKDMFENRIIEVDVYSVNITEAYLDGLNKSIPNMGVSVESLNSGSLNSRRRQLPQIPLDTQRKNRDKIAIDLTEKARKIKMDIKLGKDQYSVSDSESSITQLKKNPKVNNTSAKEPNQVQQQDNFKQSQITTPDDSEYLVKQNDRHLNDNPSINKNYKSDQLNKGKDEYERYGRMNEPDNSELDNNSYLIHRRITCANSEEIKNKYPFKNINKNQPFSLESLPDTFKMQNQMSINDLNNDFENHTKNQSWSEIDNLNKEKSRSSNVPRFESNDENSLYLNTTKDPLSHHRNSTLASSPSQTFSTNTLYKPNQSSNTSGTKPEKLFSTRLLNQRTQNAAQNSSKTNLQNPNPGPNKLNGFEGDSDTSENSYQSKPINNSVLTAQNDLNKGANTNQNMKVSNLTANDGNRITTVTKNPSTNTTTTTTVINTLNDIEKTKSNPDKNDGTMSDSALTSPMSSLPETANKKRRPSMAKALVILGLSKKSNSASNLTTNKRFGFARSEEYGVMPELRNRNLSPSSGDSSTEDKKPKLWSGALKLPHEQPFNEFIENLGPGQKVSRQVLGLPCLGEIKLKMNIEKSKLNIQILEVKKLKQKIGYRLLPNIYIKFYLYNGSVCTEKHKTASQRRTLTPNYEETLRFDSDYKNKILQITVWGDYGKLDRKVFMGIVQIALDDCNLGDGIIGWYRLYPASSIITDFSTIASMADLSNAESGYSLASQKSVI